MILSLIIVFGTPAAGLLAAGIYHTRRKNRAQADEIKALEDHIRVLESRLENPNFCEDCASSAGHQIPNVMLFDAGTCGFCGKFDEVFDPDVVAMYDGFGVSPHEAWRRIRLRGMHHPNWQSKVFSLAEIAHDLHTRDIKDEDVLVYPARR